MQAREKGLAVVKPPEFGPLLGVCGRAPRSLTGRWHTWAAQGRCQPLPVPRAPRGGHSPGEASFTTPGQQITPIPTAITATALDNKEMETGTNPVLSWPAARAGGAGSAD